jgi:orotate phosphoribosyltransferase
MPASSAADETREILHRARAIFADDHFVYISGDHGSGWIDKDSIYVDLRHMARLGELSAAAGDPGVDIVCGPATGGLTTSRWTAKPK